MTDTPDAARTAYAAARAAYAEADAAYAAAYTAAYAAAYATAHAAAYAAYADFADYDTQVEHLIAMLKESES